MSFIGNDSSTVLNSSATATEINKALVNSDIVYLRPGTYNLTVNEQIVIPDGKQLVGLSSAAVEDNAGTGRTGEVYIQWGAGTKTNDGVSMGLRTAIKNVYLDFVLNTQNSSLYAINGAPVAANINDWTAIEGCVVHAWDSSGGAAITLRQGTVRGSSVRLGGSGGIYLQAKADAFGGDNWTVIENCYIEQTGANPTIEVEANAATGRTRILGCFLKGGGDGVLKGDTTANRDFHVMNCHLEGSVTATNGFSGFGGCGQNCIIEGNTVVTFTGAGPEGKWAKLTAADGTDRAVIRNNIARGNTDNTGTIPASWLASGNTVAT
jgi:hypothetical protein